MVLALAKDQSARLLKHVVRCYLRLSDNARYTCYCLFALLILLTKIVPLKSHNNTNIYIYIYIYIYI